MNIQRLVASAAVIAGVALPSVAALAQTTQWYVVQDVKTHHCTVVDKRPVATESTVVGPGGVIYHTRDEAMTAMRTVKVCTNE